MIQTVIPVFLICATRTMPRNSSGRNMSLGRMERAPGPGSNWDSEWRGHGLDPSGLLRIWSLYQTFQSKLTAIQFELEVTDVLPASRYALQSTATAKEDSFSSDGSAA